MIIIYKTMIYIIYKTKNGYLIKFGISVETLEILNREK